MTATGVHVKTSSERLSRSSSRRRLVVESLPLCQEDANCVVKTLGVSTRDIIRRLVRINGLYPVATLRAMKNLDLDLLDATVRTLSMQPVCGNHMPDLRLQRFGQQRLNVF